MKKRIRLIAAALLLCLLLAAVGCIHYLPREEESATTPDTNETESTSKPTEESNPPSHDEIPNEAEDGYTKRY